jgi:hypothetical protein
LSLIERATVKYSVLADCTSRPIPEGGGGSMGPATSEAVEWAKYAPLHTHKIPLRHHRAARRQQHGGTHQGKHFFMVMSPPKYHMPDARTAESTRAAALQNGGTNVPW